MMLPYRCGSCGRLHTQFYASQNCCTGASPGLYRETNLPNTKGSTWQQAHPMPISDAAKIFAKLYDIERWVADLKNSMNVLHDKIDSLRNEDVS